MNCEIFTWGTPLYCDVMFAALNSQSFMLARTTSWMPVLFTYENMCITLEIQLSDLKMDFIALKSIGGLAALPFSSCFHASEILMKDRRLLITAFA